MYMGKPCSKRFSRLNSVLKMLFAHESSISFWFSVFSYLRNLGPLQLRNLHIRLLEENFEKVRQFH